MQQKTLEERAHAIVDLIRPEQLAILVPMMETMLTAFERNLANAPWDDEIPNEEEERAVAESKRWLKTHEGIPHEQVLAEFGLTPEEFERIEQEPAMRQENIGA